MYTITITLTSKQEAIDSEETECDDSVSERIGIMELSLALSLSLCYLTKKLDYVLCDQAWLIRIGKQLLDEQNFLLTKTIISAQTRNAKFLNLSTKQAAYLSDHFTSLIKENKQEQKINLIMDSKSRKLVRWIKSQWNTEKTTPKIHKTIPLFKRI